MSLTNNNHCSVCSKIVLTGIFCDLCHTWIHPKCNKLDKNDFVQLQKSNEPWFCINCNDDIYPFNNDDSLTILPDVNN